MTAVWTRILQAARRYPSPHNSQPIRVRIADPDRIELYYDLDRGLPAEPYGIPFGHVCAGIFVELVAIAAHAEGSDVIENLRYDDMAFDGSDRLHPLGTITLVPAGGPVPDLDAELIARRCTSRLPYDSRTVEPAALAQLDVEARRWGHRLATTTDRPVVDEIVRINQRTLFDDIANPAVRHELATWLRYSHEEAARRRDGLSAACLGVPGRVLHWFVEHHTWWSRPGLRDVARWLYLRSMRGVRQLAWITGPFATTADSVRAGRAFIRCWLLLTAHGVAMQPFGSVITNPRAHAALVAAVAENQTDPHDGQEMTWMLMRIGYSPPPPRSHRLSVDTLLVEAV
ncbi:MAG: hypothetical protein KY460_16055 [Actinobacteria bacterium]|nr:hypothetical protein [Actinomycetota bacterium]